MASRRRKRRQKKTKIEEAVKDLNQNTLTSDKVAKDGTESTVANPQGPRGASRSESKTDAAYSDRIIKTLDNVEQLLTQVNQPSQHDSSAAPEWLAALNRTLEKSHDKIVSQLNQVTQRFERQLEEMRKLSTDRPGKGTVDAYAKALIPVSSDKRTENKKAENDSADSTDPLSDWEKRKLEMYAEYGEPAPNEAAAETSSKEKQKDRDDLASLQESLHDSIESLDGVQAEEIEDLRAKLTEKLREAEVELSINRAKLDQRKAELERRQTELDRREKSLNSKYANVNGAPQKMGVLDRLTRHLGVRKQADSL